MAFHVIPWMWGVDGNKTCGISDSIYITDKGCESFFTLDRDFTVKPNTTRTQNATTKCAISEPKLIVANDSKSKNKTVKNS